MPDRSLTFDIEAIDKAGRAFESVALRLDKLTLKLDRLDKKRVNVDVDANTRGAQAHLDEFGGLAARAGVSSGQGFTAGFSGVLTSPYGIAAIAALALAALPPAAALAGGATVLALGLGLSGLGAVVEAKTAEGERALQGFKSTSASILRQTAAPFEDTFNSILASGEHSLTGLSGYLHRFFTSTGPSTEAFFENLGQGVDELGPSVDALGGAFSSLLDTIGPQLPGLFKEIDGTLTDLFATVGENPQTFVDLGGYILTAAQDATDLLSGLVRIANWFDSNPIAHGVVSGVFGSGELHALGDLYDWITDKQGRVLLSSKGTADGFTAQARAADVLDTALKGLSGGVLGVEDAENRFRDAVHQANAGLKTNGDTLSRSTAKGRANREALAAAAHAQLELVDATKQQYGPGKRANDVYSASRARLVTLAEHFGLTKKQADRYVTSVLGIPKVRNTTVNFHDGKAKKAIRAYIDAIAGIPSHRSTTVTVHTSGPGGIGSLLDKTSRYAPGNAHPHASGGPTFPGSTYLVGEQGPELLTMTGGNTGFVSTAPETRAVMAGAGGQFTGELFLDSGQFLGLVHGAIRQADRGKKTRALAGVGVNP